MDMQTTFCIVAIVITIPSYCNGYRYGPIMAACANMFPDGHGYNARNDTPPFTLTLNATTYQPGDVISVFLDSEPNPDNAEEWFFEGVLIQARSLRCNEVIAVGSFQVPACDDFLQPIDCFGLKNSALRHYTHYHVYNRTFTWTAPATSVGHVYLRATVARNQAKFWTNVFSDFITDPSDSSTNLKRCEVQSIMETSSAVVLASKTHQCVALFAAVYLMFK